MVEVQRVEVGFELVEQNGLNTYNSLRVNNKNPYKYFTESDDNLSHNEKGVDDEDDDFTIITSCNETIEHQSPQSNPSLVGKYGNVNGLKDTLKHFEDECSENELVVRMHDSGVRRKLSPFLHMDYNHMNTQVNISFFFQLVYS